MLNLVTRQVGWQYHNGKQRPIRRIRNRKIERGWWWLKGLGYRLWIGFRIWRLPDRYIIPPEVRPDSFVHEFSFYDFHERIELDIDPGTSVSWLGITNWQGNKREALYFGPPISAGIVFVGDSLVEWLRDMLEHAEELLGNG